MKKLLFLLTLSTLIGVSSMQAADVLTLGNADFETGWSALTDHGSGLKSTTLTGLDGWVGQTGDGNLVIYQGPGYSGNYSAVLINTSDNPSRFGNNSVLTLTAGKIYKVSFYVKGTAKLSVFLFKNGTNPNKAAVTGSNTNAIYDVNQKGLFQIEYTEWTKKEYLFTIPAAITESKLFFGFTNCTPLTDAENVATALMIDNVTIEPFVDNTIATLNEITVGGKAINNFNPNTTTYNILTNNATIPAIVGTPTDATATVVVGEPVQIDNTITYEIEVTAADGVTKKVYTVVFNVTNDVVLQGFTSDLLPAEWVSSQTSGTNDWMIDQNANYNNGLYMGSYSVRIKGGGAGNPSITSGWLMIPNLDLPDLLTFYMKTRVAGTSTFSVYKRPASEATFTDLTGWTLCETLTEPFDATFTEKSVSINSNQLTDILFYVEKEDEKIPFALDDIRITLKDTTTGNTQTSASKVIFKTSKGLLSFESPEHVNYAVRTLTGATVKVGQGNHVSLRLPQGFYLVEINGKTQKVVIP